MKIANLHDSPSRELLIGHIKANWRDLGRDAGTHTVGLRRIEIADGDWATPAHDHGADEEIFFVLGGKGLLWQDGKTYEIQTNDCIVHKPRRGAHTLRGGAGGLDVLVFGQRRDPALTALPRAGVAWSFPRTVELAESDPFSREAAAGAPECTAPEEARPANVIQLADAPTARGGQARLLGKGAGASATGLNHFTLAPAAQGPPPHCHSLEEEIFVVLEGTGTLELWERTQTTPTPHPLRTGDVIARPAATGVAHAIRAGEEGLTFLAYGSNERGDMRFYPETGRVALPGLGIALVSPEIEHLKSA